MPHTPIPDIPGVLLLDETTKGHLNEHVSNLCGLSSPRFPGAQPVSFSAASLDLLEKYDFWVCEKSDGIRILVFIVKKNGIEQEVWLIDRKQQYFKVENIIFPHWERRDDLVDTILDGELVIDVDPRTGVGRLVFYAFDCLVLNGENIMKRGLSKRFGRLQDWVVAPFEASLLQHPERRAQLPFEVLAKKQECSYHIQAVLDLHIPKLKHGHDGLIFTCAESEYYPGTDEKILKWKPPSENSIDFKLEVRFPPVDGDPSQPDWSAKPNFLLNTWRGKQEHVFFDMMDVDDDEWEKMRDSGDQLDDRIVEVCWDGQRGETGGWRMLRMRDDKPNANHESVMRKILSSIADGVEIDTLLSRRDAIRSAWKSRGALQQGGKVAPPQYRKAQQTPGHRGSLGPAHPVTPVGGYVPSTSGFMAGLKR